MSDLVEAFEKAKEVTRKCRHAFRTLTYLNIKRLDGRLVSLYRCDRCYIAKAYRFREPSGAPMLIQTFILKLPDGRITLHVANFQNRRF